METENRDQVKPEFVSNNRHFRESRGHVKGRIFGGLIITTVGVLLLARQMGVYFPSWLISWEMLLIVIGLYVGFKHTFRGPAWLILILIGGFFLADEIDPTLVMKEYIWPVILIAIGLAFMLRPQKKRADVLPVGDTTPSDTIHTDQDVLDSVTIFGGIKRNIFSKNFRGGEIVTIFGGTELNLSQADMVNRIELDVTQVFGGAKIIVPPHWKIHSEDIVSIFGGVEDKRPLLPNASYDPNKILVLKGTNIFGGIDIKSF